MEDKSNCIFNISGGNIQIVPNATQAVQNFYGDQFAEEALKVNACANENNATPELAEEEKALRFEHLLMIFQKYQETHP